MFARTNAPAPVTEVRAVIALFLSEIKQRGEGSGKLREAEQIGGPGFPQVIYAGNAEPVPVIFLDQDQMIVILISVEKKTVVGKVPEPSREKRKVCAADFPYL